ncbi:ABC transporter permease [Sphingobacterium sp. SGG-5]|uniref:ABC transporter permease n=1 Tax=Sphingobacterium sp. SGG-5 TaxID=2710881 RepID=UPI0013EA579D|nr:ABC transporter permease [Sphingobacterium sp. SGG-5]NGM61852.1 ABC transporter permease [Sphingobacterium sp. SGG-5]
MNFPLFLAKRIIFQGERTFSKLIVRVTIGALALAILAIILSVAILRGFKNEVTAKQRGFFSDILVVKQELGQTADRTPIMLSVTDFEKIKHLPNVVSVSPFATKIGIMNVRGEVEGVVLKGVDKDYNQKYLDNILIKGDTLDFGADNADNQILISKYTANRLNLDVDSSFIMNFVQENQNRKRKFTVKGIFRTNSEELDNSYVIGSLPLIRKLNNLEGDEAGAYEIRVADFEALAQTTEQVNEVLPVDMKATNVVEHLADIFNWLNMLDMNDDIIFVLMVIVAIINMISALLITILERTSMIGILKSLGMKSRAIRKVFLYNSFYLIGYGLLIGNFLAITLYVFQTQTHFFKLDPSIYYIEYIPMSIGWQDVMFLNVALVGIALLVLFIPSMLITRISPIKTIQFK